MHPYHNYNVATQLENLAMIMDHLELSTNQFDEMCSFYDAALAPLGIGE